MSEPTGYSSTLPSTDGVEIYDPTESMVLELTNSEEVEEVSFGIPTDSRRRGSLASEHLGGTGQTTPPLSVREQELVYEKCTEAFHFASALCETNDPLELEQNFNSCLNRLYEVFAIGNRREREFQKALLLLIHCLDDLEGDELSLKQRKAIQHCFSILRIPKLSAHDLKDVRMALIGNGFSRQ